MRIRSPLSSLLATSLVVFTLSACSEGDPAPAQTAEELTVEDRAHVAQALSGLLAAELSPESGFVTTTTELAIGEVPTWLADLDGGVFAGELFGLRWEIAITCLDAGGGTMAACGVTTDAAELSVDVAGELRLFAWTGSFEIEAAVSLGGFQDDELALASEATVALRSSFVGYGGIRHDSSFEIAAASQVGIRRADLVPVAGSAQLVVRFLRARSDTGEIARFEFVVETLIADGVATARIGGHGLRIDLVTGTIVWT